VPLTRCLRVCFLHRPEGLPFVAEGRTWSPGMISVTRPVYACTTVTAVNLDSSRAKDSNPQPCYPDICFAVDNFDNAFEDLVRHSWQNYRHQHTRPIFVQGLLLFRLLHCRQTSPFITARLHVALPLAAVAMHMPRRCAFYPVLARS
jgi:hypothetical protein